LLEDEATDSVGTGEEVEEVVDGCTTTVVHEGRGTIVAVGLLAGAAAEGTSVEVGRLALCEEDGAALGNTFNKGIEQYDT
jgi:hypothetical protein